MIQTLTNNAKKKERNKMNTKKFLNMKIQNLPYLNYYKGPSTQFHERIFIENKGKNKLMIISLTKAKKPYVSIDLKIFDETNPKKTQYIELVPSTTKFKPEMIPYEAIQ